MQFKVSGGEVIDFEFPNSLEAGDSARTNARAEATKIEALLYQFKSQDCTASKEEIDKAKHRKQELATELAVLNLWRSEVVKRENDLIAQVQSSTSTIEDPLLQAIVLREQFKIKAPYLSDRNSFDKFLLSAVSRWIKERIVEEIAENIPASFFDLTVDFPRKITPTVDISAVWQEFEKMHPRLAVNQIRHRYTSYDSDRFRRPYLDAFTDANAWIAENFPALAKEAIAQIKEKRLNDRKIIPPAQSV